MTHENILLRNLILEVRELKAMIAQLGPVSVQPSIKEEIAAVEAQGLDVIEYFKTKGKAAVKADKKPRRRSA